MIFLKKFMSAGIMAAFTGAFLCGCTTGTHTVPSVSLEEVPSASVTVEESSVSGEDMLVAAQEGVYIYDKAASLTNTEYSECNEYAAMLYKEYLLNAAVVITNDLEGMTPDEYAAEAYDNIFSGMGSGMLFLINNESQNDVLYKAGHCQRFIDEVAERDELYHATKELVVGNYGEAAMIMLKLGERCPKNVIDNSNVFSEEMAEEFSDSLAQCANPVTIIATSNGTGIANEELARTYYNRKYGDSAGYLILMDKKTRTVTGITNGELPAEIAEIVASANSVAGNNDFIGAANKIVSGFGGAPLMISEPETTEAVEYEEDTAEEE